MSNLRVPTMRWEAEARDSLEAHGPATLAYTAANNERGPVSARCKARTGPQVCPLKSSQVLWYANAHTIAHKCIHIHISYTQAPFKKIKDTLFAETDKLIVKFTQKSKEILTTKTMLKKNIYFPVSNLLQ